MQGHGYPVRGPWSVCGITTVIRRGRTTPRGGADLYLHRPKQVKSGLSTTIPPRGQLCSVLIGGLCSGRSATPRRERPSDVGVDHIPCYILHLVGASIPLHVQQCTYSGWAPHVKMQYA